MTRIIPEEANKVLKKEYTLRFFSVLFFALFVVICLSLAFVSSTYLLLYLYEKAYVTNNSNAKNETTQLYQQVTQKTEDLYLLSSKITVDKKMSAVDVAQKIFENRGEGITIQSIEMLSDSKITLRGVANTRDDILSFQNRMQQNPMFKDFSIPVESLARQKDVSFNLTFTYYEN